jgi:hypothetical protein
MPSLMFQSGYQAGVRDANERYRKLLIETLDTIRDAADGGEPQFGDLWRAIEAALSELAA